MIRIRNYSPFPFTGWKRVTVSEQLPFAAGRVNGTLLVVGAKLGRSTWCVDVKLESLASGETIELDPSHMVEEAFQIAPLPADTLGFFGGAPKINNVPFLLEAGMGKVDGSAYRVRMHARATPMLHVRVFGLWRPDEPEMMQGEVVVTCSNGADPALSADVPVEGLRITWGSGLTHILGLGWGQSLLPPQSLIADGQAKGMPLHIVWLDKIPSTERWQALAPTLLQQVCGIGLKKLFPQGNPRFPATFDADTWTRTNYSESLRRMHTFEQPVCGPTIRSANAGAQEDQVFTGGESLLARGLGAEMVSYYSSLSMLARPCHHLEADGSLADSKNHPRCMFWYARPHFGTQLDDHLGKPGALPIELARGWDGPDREHWFYNRLFSAARITGSQALQWELEQQAHIFLFQETVPSEKQGWATNGADAARARGWASWVALLLDEILEDRVLAARVVDRWRKRFFEVYLPASFPARPGGVWDPRHDDPRLGQGDWWMPWQQAVGAYFVYKAGETFGVPEAKVIGAHAARAVVDAIVSINGRWTFHGDYLKVDGTAWTLEPPMFWLFGSPMAVATVLLDDPNDLRVRSIMDQMLQDAEGSSFSWFPPEIT